MSFTYPLVLFLQIIPVALLVWVWTRESNRLVLPFDHGNQKTGSWLGILINLAESVPAVLLSAVVAILAGPQQLGEPKSKKVLTNIEFCVDVSGSMNAQFGEGTRYDASMKAIDEFLDYREGDAFGLTFFGNEVLHWVPLTNDVTAIRCAPPFMNPKNPGHPPWLGGTAIGKALVACHKVLTQREEGDRMIILVSDGSSFDLFNGSDIEIAKKLNADNIRVFGIHISSGGVPDPIVNITQLTGGEVFNPGDPGGLDSVFKRIDEMQETRMEKVSAETMDYFYPLALGALITLALGLAFLFGLRYTPW
jgi:Ca-activated chloride channel family protein